jgi:hypothetical protein
VRLFADVALVDPETKGSSPVHGVSPFDGYIVVDVTRLRTAEEPRLRLPPRYLLVWSKGADFAPEFLHDNLRVTVQPTYLPTAKPVWRTADCPEALPRQSLAGRGSRSLRLTSDGLHYSPTLSPVRR